MKYRNSKENEKQKKVYKFVKTNPGLHLKKLSTELNIPKSTITYYLSNLEKKGLIIRVNNNYCTRFYPINQMGVKDKELLTLMRQPILQKIILYLCIHIASSETDIAKDIEKNLATINYHLQKLIDKDIIEIAPYKNGSITSKNGSVIIREKLANEKYYRMKNPQEIYNFIIKYNYLIKEDELTEFLVSLLDYHKKMKFKIRKFYSQKKGYENLLEQVFDVFPHPYHI